MNERLRVVWNLRAAVGRHLGDFVHRDVLRLAMAFVIDENYLAITAIVTVSILWCQL